MKDNYCPHCWPVKRRSHLLLHLEYYINRLSKVILFPAEALLRLKPSLTWGSSLTGWLFFLKFLALLRLVKFEEQVDETKLFNRSMIFLREAKKRGIKIKAVKLFGDYKNEFIFELGGQEQHFEGIPGVRGRNAELSLDNKFLAKQKLHAAGLPVARGQLFTDKNSALEFGRRLGFPLVVKPNSGSLSHHASYPLTNSRELVDAIKIAKQYQPDFIVEQYLSGKFYRATVVGGKRVFVCEKDPPSVIGNGRSTITELIQQKNDDPRRGGLRQRNTTLHEITIDEELKNYLRSQNLSLDSVPDQNQKIYLKDKVTLSSGCDIINQTKETHPENLAAFLRVAEVMNVDLVGIDIICEDITKPHHEQQAGIIELNSLPFIDMHEHPSHGAPEPVAEIVWDLIEQKLK